MTGLALPGPKERLATPGVLANASATVPPGFLASSTASRLVIALNASNVVAAPDALAVTVTSS